MALSKIEEDLSRKLSKASLLMRKACLNWTASQWGCVRPMRAQSSSTCLVIQHLLFPESIGWAFL